LITINSFQNWQNCMQAQRRLDQSLLTSKEVRNKSKIFFFYLHTKI